VSSREDDPEDQPAAEAEAEVGEVDADGVPAARGSGDATWADGAGGAEAREAVEAGRQAAAVAQAEEQSAPVVPRVGGPAPRPPMLGQGLAAAVLAGLLALASSFGSVPLVVLLLALQVLLALGFLALVDAPAAGGAFPVVVGATVAADVVALTGDGSVSGLAGVTALALVASLFHQLARAKRSRVTESLADTLVAVVLMVAMACLLALRELDGGEEAVAVALAGAAGALAGGRLGDRIAPRPGLTLGATRGWPGLLLALGAGALAAAAVAGDGGAVAGRDGLLLGLAVAVAASAGDLTVDLGASELRAGWRDARRVASLRPVGLLLPFATVAPVAFVAGRLVLV
jgi:hypothetical protein